jgi:hypothetical protein
MLGALPGTICNAPFIGGCLDFLGTLLRFMEAILCTEGLGEEAGDDAADWVPPMVQSASYPAPRCSSAVEGFSANKVDCAADGLGNGPVNYLSARKPAACIAGTRNLLTRPTGAITQIPC